MPTPCERVNNLFVDLNSVNCASASAVVHVHVCTCLMCTAYTKQGPWVIIMSVDCASWSTSLLYSGIFLWVQIFCGIAV